MKCAVWEPDCVKPVSTVKELNLRWTISHMAVPGMHQVQKEWVCPDSWANVSLPDKRGYSSGILRKPRGLDPTMGSPKLDQKKSQHLFNCSENIY